MTFCSLISLSGDRFGADSWHIHDSNTLYTCILQYNIGIPTLYMENLKVRTNAFPYHVFYKSMRKFTVENWSIHWWLDWMACLKLLHWLWIWIKCIYQLGLHSSSHALLACGDHWACVFQVQPQIQMSCSQLHKRAERIGCMLMEKGRLNTGDHVALIYPPGNFSIPDSLGILNFQISFHI